MGALVVGVARPAAAASRRRRYIFCVAQQQQADAEQQATEPLLGAEPQPHLECFGTGSEASCVVGDVGLPAHIPTAAEEAALVAAAAAAEPEAASELPWIVLQAACIAQVLQVGSKPP